MPFPTALLADYLNRRAANIAVAIYCATYLLLNVGFNLLWWSASASPGLLKAHVSRAVTKRIRRAYLIGFAVYAASVVIALWAPYVGLAASMSMWVVWAGLNYSAGER